MRLWQGWHEAKLGCHGIPSGGTLSMCPSAGDVFDQLIKLELLRLLHGEVTLHLFVLSQHFKGQ